MNGTAGKLWLAIAFLAFGSTVVYAVASDGEWFGTFVLGSLVVAAGVLVGLSSATNDGDPASPAETLPTVLPRRALPAAWPALGALGTGTTLIGLAGGTFLFWTGLGILTLVFGEWLVQGWAERSTGDDAANQELRNRLMFPLEVPLTAGLGVGLIVVSFSRVLLALPKTGSTVVAIVVASVILGIAALVAARPRLSSSLVTAVVAVGALVFLITGVIGAVSGHRTFEEHHSEDQGEATAEETNDR